MNYEPAIKEYRLHLRSFAIEMGWCLGAGAFFLGVVDLSTGRSLGFSYLASVAMGGGLLAVSAAWYYTRFRIWLRIDQVVVRSAFKTTAMAWSEIDSLVKVRALVGPKVAYRIKSSKGNAYILGMVENVGELVAALQEKTGKAVQEEAAKFQRLVWLIPCAALIVPSVVSRIHNNDFRRALEMACAGVRLEEDGDLKGALKKYEQALGLSPDFTYALALSGSVHHRFGRDKKALENYEKALDTCPRHFWVHYLMGRLYRDQGRYKEAIDKFNELAAMKDNWYSSNKTFGYTHYQNIAHGDLGFCYAKLGDRNLAIESYKRYLALNPRAADRAAVTAYINKKEKRPR